MVCLSCVKYLSPKKILEVSGCRFQPQRQRHVLEDTPEANGHEKQDCTDMPHDTDYPYPIVILAVFLSDMAVHRFDKDFN